MTRYAAPGTEGAIVTYASRYDHWIGGAYVPPVRGGYFENPSPVNGRAFTEIARGTAEDVELALDAAHSAAPAWGATPAGDRAAVLNRIADRMEAHLEELAVAESWENGKPVRETLAADIPLAIDHFRYFAGVLRAQEGSLSELDEDTVAYHFHEPLGVVGQIIPWNFPILMATWKLAPALAAGNAVVLKPAEQTPASIHFWMSLVADLLPPGIVNIVNGFGEEAGKPLASSPRVAKIAFTGETTTGRLIMRYASENLKPVTLELGGKSPNIFFDDVSRSDDDFLDKALEGFTMFALNQGEVCTCPSRALIQRGHYGAFLEAGIARTEKILPGNPLDTDTMIGAQASDAQLQKILSYLEIGRQEGAKILTGGQRIEHGGGTGGRLLRPADGLRGRQPECGSSRRRSSARSWRWPPSPTSTTPSRPANDTLVRARGRCMEPRHQHRVPGGPRDQGGPGLDELLPRVSGPRCVRRLQGVPHRPGEPQDDAGALPADEEPSGVVLAHARALLQSSPRAQPPTWTRTCTTPAPSWTVPSSASSST
ncbi:NAD/NADP-dependent betaine aldehyde dehydrogenase [Streptomyces cyaneofuscatus]